ncbi:MAG: DUF4258 domain-containing protein [Oscillospiraceae bacterium]|jgi:hypothetical protein|nr:DUF4258 domain-containing protein [Oscillospiraceae bacterium]
MTKKQFLADGLAAVLKDFCSQTGLLRQREREQVAATKSAGKTVSFGRSPAQKAVQAAKAQQRLDSANKELNSLREDGTIRVKGMLVKAPAVPGTLTFSGHALDRLSERGMTLQDVERIIKSPKFAIRQRNGTQHVYYSEAGFIAIKSDGTVSSIGQLDEGGKTVLEVAKKYGFYHESKK